jgi:cytochrome oxidase Cu insertion factor (SCO1/SenC/PrrC family)
MSTTAIVLIVVVIAALVGGFAWLKLRGLRKTPPQLRAGRPLPDFRAIDEQGDPVRSMELHGSPTVILFVRGNWCPFCSRQVST